MLAAIPYRTFPTIIELGPLPLRTFGLMVGIAMLSGSWVAAQHAERFGIDRDEIFNLALRMVLAGVIGARLTWAVTHWDSIDSPVDVIAVWQGGLQFSGGFIFAVLAGLPVILKWDRLTRWRVLDGAAMGLAIGVFFGRIGCVAVGEHFGGVTDFPLAVRWEGGAVPDVREPVLGLGADAVPVTEGLVFHNTALYEMLAALVLFVVLRLLYRRGVGVGVLGGTFLLAYAPLRFGFDALRVNDERVAGLTGAQWMTLAIVPIALWILFRIRPQVHELELADAARPPAATAPTGGDTAEGEGPGVDVEAEAAEMSEVRTGSGTDEGAEASVPETDPDADDVDDVDDVAPPGGVVATPSSVDEERSDTDPGSPADETAAAKTPADEPR